MSDFSIFHRFKEYCNLIQLTLDNTNHENAFMGIFVRKEFLALSSNNSSFSELIHYIEAIFSLADLGKVESSIPFLLIEDLIEFGSYEALNHLLPYLDVKSKLWATKMSSKKGVGLILLRSVNLLRKKIVRSEHSKLAGLSLLILTKIFPAGERSGVNLKGDRNVDNKNLNQLFAQTGQESFYFGSLHNLFYIHPSKLSDKENWSMLSQSVDILLAQIEEAIQKATYSSNHPFYVHEFFTPQHLFSEKSFELQMDEQCFRLSLLSQILVMLQDFNCYLNENEKAGNIIDRSQEAWIGETTKKTFYLISLHHNGKEYFRFLRSMFRNEKNWIGWKVSSCPSYEKEDSAIQFSFPNINTSSARSELLLMGNEELNRLWDYNLSDIENRKLKPEVESYLEQAKGDEEDDFVDTNINWRAGRLSWKIIL